VLFVFKQFSVCNRFPTRQAGKVDFAAIFTFAVIFNLPPIKNFQGLLNLSLEKTAKYIYII